MSRVAIIHPWFPQYRAEFFNRLVPAARAQGIEVSVFFGAPPREWQARTDSLEDSRYTELPTKFIKLGGNDLIYKRLSLVKDSGPFDLVVLEQAVRNIETYQFLLCRRHPAIAFWGHGRTYTKPISRAQELLKRWLTRKGVWFFAYTRGGRDAVRGIGFPSNQITVVQNSIDTSLLRRQLDSVTDEEVLRFCAKHGLNEANALFIGGLDSSKRLEFLVDAGRIAHGLDPEFRLLVGGAGEQEEWIRTIADREPWLIFLGKLTGRSKALAMASSAILAMPGRVGLVAVDSFAAGLPIVTTKWPWHAPEVEYLEDGRNSRFTEDDEYAFAAGMVDTIRDAGRRDMLSESCLQDGHLFTVEAMVANFVDGLVSAVNMVQTRAAQRSI